MIKSDNKWKKQTVLFLISQSITLFGSTLVQMAIVWYVTLRTSSGAWRYAGQVFGLLGSMYSGFLPFGMAVFGLLADVIPLRLIMVCSGGALILIAAVMRASKRFRD